MNENKQLIGKESIYVDYKLTQDEVIEVKKEFCNLLTKRDDIEAIFKVARANYKSELENVEQQLSSVREVLDSELRTCKMECDVYLDMEEQKRLYYDSRGDLVKVLPFREEDYQLKISVLESEIRIEGKAEELAEQLKDGLLV